MSGNMSGDSDEWVQPGCPEDDYQTVDLDLSSDTGGAPEPVPDSGWLVTAPSPSREPTQLPRRRGSVRRRVPLRGWAGLAAVAAVTVGVVIATRGPHDPGTGAPAPTSASAAPVGACAGLSGAVITDRAGDPSTLPGVIATFEDAYYTQRSAESAMKVVAPESGITHQSLADGIATIPLGTTYCVAIDPVAPVAQSTASVHIVELRPDGKRVDYLQVINTITGPGGGLLISHVQGQG
ncbi:hypothetical protein [Nocardia wallacei]|uniref:hypothetical protein n=1 Tax=Nocardia wallacei TaxID=480035 RepID=UPI002454F1AC|nr:hypothetical protein [Nocardia wallacei]